jgi:hypothetical protein
MKAHSIHMKCLQHYDSASVGVVHRTWYDRCKKREMKARVAEHSKRKRETYNTSVPTNEHHYLVPPACLAPAGGATARPSSSAPGGIPARPNPQRLHQLAPSPSVRASYAVPLPVLNAEDPAEDPEPKFGVPWTDEKRGCGCERRDRLGPNWRELGVAAKASSRSSSATPGA